jgi:hypothetical protein
MVAALEQLFAAGLADGDRMQAVTTGVNVPMESSLSVANDDDRNIRDLRRDVIASLRKICFATDALPRLLENQIPFDLVQARIGIEPCRKLPTILE